MKHIFLPALFLLLSHFCFSQDKGTTKEDFAIPSSKSAVNDLLEEVKQKISDTEKKIKSLQTYAQVLSAYKAKISSFDPARIDHIYTSIAEHITTKDNEAIYAQEGSLIDLLQSLSFYYRPFTSSNDYYYDNPDYTDFSARIADILKPVQSNEDLNLIANNHDNDNNKTTIKDTDKLLALRKAISSSIIADTKERIQPVIDAQIVKSKKDIEDGQAELQTLRSNKSRIMEKLNEQETQINDLAIKIGLPLFCLTILLLFLGPSFINRANQLQKNETSSQNVLLEISTVLLLTMSILILGLSGKIQSDVLGTLIGGISGYVLNRIRNRGDVPGGG